MSSCGRIYVGCLLIPPPSPGLLRAQGGNWLPQELHARREGLRRGQVSLTHQLERLTEAYLASVVALEEYSRRRRELERRSQALEEQQRQLAAQVDRRQELVDRSISLDMN
jgi:site-specific DNA recombinase